MSVPTVNITVTLYEQDGSPIAGATVEAELIGIDVYQAQYVGPIKQGAVTDANGLATLALFPNALGERNTFYTFKGKHTSGRVVLNTTAIVPNTNVDLSTIEGGVAVPQAVTALYPLTPMLSSLNSQPSGPDKLPYFSGVNLFSLADFTAFARQVVASVSAAALVGLLSATSPTFASMTLSTGNLTVSAGTIGLSTDVLLARDAANVLAQRNGTNAQAFRIYNTFTDASNYERISVDFTGNVGFVRTINAGTGVGRDIKLRAAQAAYLESDNGNFQVVLTVGGHFHPGASNSADLGISGTTWHTGYFGTSVVTPLVGTDAASALNLTTSGGTQLQIGHIASAVEFLTVQGATTGGAPLLTTGNSAGTDIPIRYRTKGTGAHVFETNNTQDNSQLHILHTASATRFVTITGSAGGNPALSVSAGALALGAAATDIQWLRTNIALGGGAAPTVGTIGGSGPAAAAQRNWLRFIESDGTASFIPVWR